MYFRRKIETKWTVNSDLPLLIETMLTISDSWPPTLESRKQTREHANLFTRLLHGCKQRFARFLQIADNYGTRIKRARSIRLSSSNVVIVSPLREFFFFFFFEFLDITECELITVKCVSLRVDVINAAPILSVDHAALHANALMTARSFNIRFELDPRFSLFFLFFHQLNISCFE